jgi:hypothetical protein
MAIPDPIPTITVDSVTYDFARNSFGPTSGVFATANGNDVLTFSKALKNRNRHSIRVDRRKTAADPLDAGLNQVYRASAYVVFDSPTVGFTAAELDKLGQLLVSVMTSGTPDYVLRALQGEL